MGYCRQSADAAAGLAHQTATTLQIPLSKTNAAKALRSLARGTTFSQRSTEEFTRVRIGVLDPHLQSPLPLSLPRCEATLLCSLWLGVGIFYVRRMLSLISNITGCVHC